MNHLDDDRMFSARVKAKFALRGLSLVGLIACGCSEPEIVHGDKSEPIFVEVVRDYGGTLFSVSGTSSRDVWVVGNRRALGEGPTVQHFDGSAWSKVDGGEPDTTAFWVHAVAPGTAWISGSNGTIYHYANEKLARVDAPPSLQPVWGIWTSAEGDEVWAVGGDPAQSTGGFIWRGDSDGFAEVKLDSELPRPSAWYKAWGIGSQKIWFCGSDGSILHFDGTSFSVVQSASDRSLLTISGRMDGSLIAVVGGQFSSTVLTSNDGTTFQDVTPPGPPLQTFGVSIRNNWGYAVGLSGVVLSLEGQHWVEESTSATNADLHGVWIDDEGGTWSVGGQILFPPFDSGTLVYRGRRQIPVFK